MTTSSGAAGFAAGDIFLFQVRDSDTGSLVATPGRLTLSQRSVTAAGGDVTNKYVDITVTAAVMKDHAVRTLRLRC